MEKNKNGILVKTSKELEKMAEGGVKLGKIKKKLEDAIDIGVNAEEIEKLADELIAKEGGKPSFKMVDRYHWATCINVNEGVVHGIPKKDIVFAKGDIVSVDIGMYYRGFHTDSSFSVGVNVTNKLKDFLKVGKKALESGISEARLGNRIYDISKAIESVLRKGKTLPIRALVGHGIGRSLHEQPQIPCFASGIKGDSPKIPIGATFAIEVMYTKGSGNIELGGDGWTIRTSDGKIAGLFEETIAVTRNGPIILTRDFNKAN
jgi:methionyl aminopeptidase